MSLFCEEKYDPWQHLGATCDPVPLFDMHDPMGFAYVAPGKRIRPIMEVILFGLKDKNSPLSVLGGSSWRYLVRCETPLPAESSFSTALA
jgi:hypothetical protein